MIKRDVAPSSQTGPHGLIYRGEENVFPVIMTATKRWDRLPIISFGNLVPSVVRGEEAEVLPSVAGGDGAICIYCEGDSNGLCTLQWYPVASYVGLRDRGGQFLLRGALLSIRRARAGFCIFCCEMAVSVICRGDRWGPSSVIWSLCVVMCCVTRTFPFLYR